MITEKEFITKVLKEFCLEGKRTIVISIYYPVLEELHSYELPLSDYETFGDVSRIYKNFIKRNIDFGYKVNYILTK